MHIVLGGDHHTTELLSSIINELEVRGFSFDNFGAKTPDEKTSLQTLIPKVTESVLKSEATIGILLCGTGVGVEIGANRIKGIRASLCRDAEQAKNARIYDNANILCLGSWYVDDFLAILNAFLINEFDGDLKRKEMLKDFDNF